MSKKECQIAEKSLVAKEWTHVAFNTTLEPKINKKELKKLKKFCEERNVKQEKKLFILTKSEQQELFLHSFEAVSFGPANSEDTVTDLKEIYKKAPDLFSQSDITLDNISKSNDLELSSIGEVIESDLSGSLFEVS